MQLLRSIWLLSILLLVAGQQSPAAGPASKDPAVAANAANATHLNSTLVTPGSKSAPGSLGAAVGGPVQTKNPVVPQQDKPANNTAATENAGKKRNRTDTGLPAAPMATSKPGTGEQKVTKVNETANSSSTATTSSSTSTTTTTAKPAAGSPIVTDGQSMQDVTKVGKSSSNGPAIPSSSSTTTTTTTTTATTTTTTTPKPKKPNVAVSTDVHQEWEKDVELHKTQEKPGPVQPQPPVGTQPEPEVQGLTGSSLADHGDNGYVVPIVTVLLTVPLALGVVTIMYRRFRDMWSTRHYRRMDFLVDGMYND